MDNSMNIKTGDTVMLRSGSASLTVENIRDDECVEVAWMAGGYIQRDAFHYSQLVKLIHQTEDVTL